MDYNFREIEQKWQAYWAKNKTFKASNTSSKPKYYALDMFPYPSGAGLHVGHPLGYIAGDIISRYKRLQGFNVLHPMGYDAYGLPAEQYAIQTGQHPAVTTEININRYREQLDKIGFSFDWDREVRTCDPAYYKWTQWTFIQLFTHWYDKQMQKARPITELESLFAQEGNTKLQADEQAVCNADTPIFTAQDWNAKTEKEQQIVLMNYRLAYLCDTMVNWCPHLGTVLANDEVVSGLSVRGGHPVERKLMRQWSLRISAYCDRLLEGLDSIDWSDSIKEIQRNWIGKSVGASVFFDIAARPEQKMEIFTTRPDTLFGVSFMVLCPEYEALESLLTPAQKTEVEAYVHWAKNRSERERQAEVNKVSGVFTGSYAVNPFTNEEIPIWVSEYVLAGYGTGAIMAVPAHDSRDYRFAKHFNLPIRPVVEGGDISQEAYEAKDGILINSDFINGLRVKEAIPKIVEEIEKRNLGKAKVNYRLRDAIFSRQRYWGEPFPVYYKEGMPYMLNESELPLTLPEVDKYLPTESGEPPLARAENWVSKEGYPLETNTMPGFAGSSAYYLRYMDPTNENAYFSKEANAYWQNVDLYIGGSEHATGHLIYARFWNKFLFDIGLVCQNEPFKKLINQGMIQGRSSFAYRLNAAKYDEFLVKRPDYAGLISLGRKTEAELKGRLIYVSKNIENRAAFTDSVHVDIHFVENDVLNTEAFKNWMPDLAQAEFICEENGKYICGWEIEKMSKSMYNVQNPDELVEQYGADTLRMYEMFLGPLEQSKPWDTQGIEGVYRFLRKFWRLYHNDQWEWSISEETPTAAEYKSLHKCIKKIQDDTERFSFNTAVSTFMICVNELTDLKCNKRAILEPLLIMLSPYAPHISEELWANMGHAESVSFAVLPVFEEKYVIENSFTYPVSFNGKTRFMLELPVNMPKEEIEKQVLAHEDAQKWIGEGGVKKVIVVPNKIVNVVV